VEEEPAKMIQKEWLTRHRRQLNSVQNDNNLKEKTLGREQFAALSAPEAERERETIGCVHWDFPRWSRIQAVESGNAGRRESSGSQC
jgi:hypothetical protein